jgi:hypothetical protein
LSLLPSCQQKYGILSSGSDLDSHLGHFIMPQAPVQRYG